MTSANAGAGACYSESPRHHVPFTPTDCWRIHWCTAAAALAGNLRDRIMVAFRDPGRVRFLSASSEFFGGMGLVVRFHEVEGKLLFPSRRTSGLVGQQLSGRWVTMALLATAGSRGVESFFRE